MSGSEDANEYTKTRYSIVVLSLNHFMEIHENFKELLLLVSLLNSQYIPRELLEKYKKNIMGMQLTGMPTRYSVCY